MGVIFLFLLYFTISFAGFSLMFGYKEIILIFSVMCGILLLYSYGKNQKIDFQWEDTEEESGEEIKEKERILEFSERHPRINHMFGFGWIARWIYKEGLWYSCVFLLLIVVGFVLRIYEIGDSDFWNDEFQVVSAAAGYYQSGTFHSFDFINNTISAKFYTRAWPHTWLIAQSYKIFGISEWSSRIVSVLFGTFLIYLSYILGKRYAGSKLMALMFTLAVAFSPLLISISRYTRMYALFIPLYFLSTYLIYRGLTETSNFKNIKSFNKYLSYFDFNYSILFLGLAIFFLSYVIHLNTVIFGAPLMIFLGYMAILKREKKYIYSFVILGSLIITAIFVAFLTNFSLYLKKITDFVGIVYPPHSLYWTDLFSDNFTVYIVSMGLLLFSIPFMIRNTKFVYLSLITFSTAIILVHFADRYHSSVYISNIIPLSLLLIIMSLFNICKKIKNKGINTFLIIVFVALIGMNFYSNIDNIYNKEDLLTQNVKFKPAYETIIENSEDEQVILGQYLRAYYIKDAFKNKNLTFVSMGSYQDFSYDEFQDVIHRFDSGWVTWETRKSYHIENNTRDYVEKNFVKYHGEGIDTTNVEIFYFNKSMIK